MLFPYERIATQPRGSHVIRLRRIPQNDKTL